MSGPRRRLRAPRLAPGAACLVSLVVALLAAADAVEAHRLSPAYFGLTETAPDVFDAQWKVSISGGLVDVLAPQVPAGCAVEGGVRSYVVDDARVQHAVIMCDGPLGGREFRVAGLEATATDVLLRVDYLGGTSFTHRLVPDRPSVVIPTRPGAFDVVKTYLALGVEHILLGIDHLLFVLALLLLVRRLSTLAATITAFTVAHSITLGAATLGYVSVPSAPVEATIALSILFLATELARGFAAGSPEARHVTLAYRFPWIVAFTFGLLHGFGFAGALSEVGLPADAIPLALLFFNVGVEIGQLAFVGAVLALGAMFRAAKLVLPVWAPRLTTYVIGSVSAFWVLERTVTAL